MEYVIKSNDFKVKIKVINFKDKVKVLENVIKFVSNKAYKVLIKEYDNLTTLLYPSPLQIIDEYGKIVFNKQLDPITIHEFKLIYN